MPIVTCVFPDGRVGLSSSPVRALAEYLGHHSAAFTLSTYTHLMPSAHDRMREAIDAGLSADGSSTAREAGNTR